MTLHIQITFASTFLVDVAFRLRFAFFSWRQYVFNWIILHIDQVTPFEKFFIDIFLPHCIHWALRWAKIHNALTRYVNDLTFSQKFAVHICETPLTFVTFCPVFGLRPNLSTGMFIISPKIINYFLQSCSFLHFFQNKKTTMTTKHFLPRLNLLSWIEHITKVIVQLSWWR